MFNKKGGFDFGLVILVHQVLHVGQFVHGVVGNDIAPLRFLQVYGERLLVLKRLGDLDAESELLGDEALELPLVLLVLLLANVDRGLEVDDPVESAPELLHDEARVLLGDARDLLLRVLQ